MAPRWEPYELRDSRTVLREPRGGTPRGYSPVQVADDESCSRPTCELPIRPESGVSPPAAPLLDPKVGERTFTTLKVALSAFSLRVTPLFQKALAPEQAAHCCVRQPARPDSHS